MRILFLGTRKLGYQGLQAILAAGHEVVGVVSEDYEITEGYTSKDFREIAEKHHIPFYQTDRINNEQFVKIFAEMNIDLGVSLYWKRLVGKAIIASARQGFINAHAADLPRFRGFAAINYAILLGEEKLGLCIHQMTPMEADTGDILARRYVNITPETTIGELLESFNENFVAMTIQVLSELEAGTLQPIKQDLSRVVNAYPRLPRDGKIDWSQSAASIDRLIKSVSHPYPGAYTYWNGQKLFLWKACTIADAAPYIGSPGHVVQLNADKTVWVTTGAGIIGLESVQLAGGSEMKPRDLLNSVQIRFGFELEEEILALKQRIAQLEKQP